jgi:BspA type Leucine rich repeat region (6 copies)
MYSITNPIDLLSLLRTNVFYGCNAIQNFTIESTKEDSVILSDSITSLGEGVFQDCTSIVDAYIDISMNEIPKDTFNGCINLTQVYFVDGNNIQILGDSAFANTSLSQITMPQTLTTIGSNCFNSCVNLEKIIFFGLIQTIAQNSFDNCLQLTIQNSALIVNSNDNQVVTTYFQQQSFDVKIIDYANLDSFLRFFQDASTILETTYEATKSYFYPYVDIRIDSERTLSANIPLINNDITNATKQILFKQLILKFIFETNKPFNSFITSNTNIILSTSAISQSIYEVVVYNTQSKDVVVSNEIYSNRPAIYVLLNSFYSEFLINNYKLRLSISSNISNPYQFNYSNDNFVSSSLENKQSLQTFDLTNYSIYVGSNNDVLIYKNTTISSLPLSLYLEALQLTITSSKSEIITGPVTNPMSADAYASIDIPLSLVVNTFLYWSDGINVDNVVEDGVKFKTINYSGWQNSNYYLARAEVTQNKISYYKPQSVMAKNQIKYDFVRYLALKIFKTSAGADIFRNNDQVTTGLENLSQLSLTNKLTDLQTLGEFTIEDTSINNVSGAIFRQILLQEPSRIIPNENAWTPMNLYAGDKLYVKLTINPEPNQHKLLNPNNTTPIPARSYLIEMNLISG